MARRSQSPQPHLPSPRVHLLPSCGDLAAAGHGTLSREPLLRRSQFSSRKSVPAVVSEEAWAAPPLLGSGSCALPRRARRHRAAAVPTLTGAVTIQMKTPKQPFLGSYGHKRALPVSRGI